MPINTRRASASLFISRTVVSTSPRNARHRQLHVRSFVIVTTGHNNLKPTSISLVSILYRMGDALFRYSRLSCNT
ncbi:hypothetical protein BT69DRAFT_1278701 [Atractiella rhizophila]|nr:hypothetical protein BT69DRAFT_1278701 [Atractiella rhizophila]